MARTICILLCFSVSRNRTVGMFSLAPFVYNVSAALNSHHLRKQMQGGADSAELIVTDDETECVLQNTYWIFLLWSGFKSFEEEQE